MIVLYALKVFLFGNHSLTQILLRFLFSEITSSDNNWQQDVANSSNRRSSFWSMRSGRLSADEYISIICSERKFSQEKKLNELQTSLEILNLFHYNSLLRATIRIVGRIVQMYQGLQTFLWSKYWHIIFISYLANEWNGQKTLILSSYVNHSFLNHGTTSMVVRSDWTVGREKMNHSINSQACLPKLHKDPFKTHCVKRLQIRSFLWSIFSCIRTEYGDPNTGK